MNTFSLDPALPNAPDEALALLFACVVQFETPAQAECTWTIVCDAIEGIDRAARSIYAHAGVGIPPDVFMERLLVRWLHNQIARYRVVPYDASRDTVAARLEKEPDVAICWSTN